MTRPLRVEVASGAYHVTSRGDGREDLFRDDGTRKQFLALLGHTSARFGWCCLAYCLITNHDHLMIRTPTPNLVIGKKRAHTAKG